MNQIELEATADAVEGLAKKHGVAWYFNRDAYREIAAVTINAYLQAHSHTVGIIAAKAAASAKPSANPPQPPSKGSPT